MSPTRRDFIRGSVGAGGALSLGLAWRPRVVRPIEKAREPLRILVLGGTRFLGIAQVEYALARGHTVTLFNRGQTNPHLFPEVEKLIGDRNDNLTALEGHEWDVVIDNSSSIPRWVRQSAGLLKDAVQRYLYVSSISAFADFATPGMDETAPVGTIEDETVEEITGETYGPLKALCEQEAERVFPGMATIVRPGLIVGPHDNTDRFTYWPVRIDRGGEVVAPGNPTDPIQIIDVRDLGEWMVRMLEEGHAGTYNATGPKTPLSMAEMLYGIRAVTTANVSFTWIDAKFLREHEVNPWQHMTAWFPPEDDMEGFARVDCNRAFDKGLTFRPLAVTARDTIDWYNTLPEDRRAEPRAGLPAEKEREVLEAWRSRTG